MFPAQGDGPVASEQPVASPGSSQGLPRRGSEQATGPIGHERGFGLLGLRPGSLRELPLSCSEAPQRAGVNRRSRLGTAQRLCGDRAGVQLQSPGSVPRAPAAPSSRSLSKSGGPARHRGDYPRPLVASASHRSRAPRHPRDPGKRPAQPTRPRRATATRDARLPGGGGEYYTTEGGPGAQIGQRDGTRGPARSAPRLPAPIASGFAQRGRRVEKTGERRASPTGFQTARERRGGNLPGARPRARAAAAAAPSPWSSSPPRRAAPALAWCPASLAAAMLRPRPPCCSPRSPPGLREPGQVGRRRAPSGRCVRRPRSRPRLCSAR